MLNCISTTTSMQNNKVSKKALKSLLNDSMREAIGRLELPEPTKKVKKLINKSSKRIASEFADLLKKQIKKAKEEEQALVYVEDMLSGKKGKKKSKKAKIEKTELA